MSNGGNGAASPTPTAGYTGSAIPPQTDAAPTAPTPTQTPQAQTPQDQPPPSLLGAHATVPMISPTGRSYDIPRDKVNDAVNANWKIGQDMMSPNGKPFLIPMDQVHNAITQGKFSIAAPPGQPGMPRPDAIQKQEPSYEEATRAGPYAPAGAAERAIGREMGGTGEESTVGEMAKASAKTIGAGALAAGTVAGIGELPAATQAAITTVLPVVTKGVQAFNAWISASPANAIKAYMAYDAFKTFIAPHIPGLRAAGEIAGKAIRAYEPPVP